METCTVCGESIVGEAWKIVDGYYSEDGEFHHRNTETYHATCVDLRLE